MTYYQLIQVSDDNHELVIYINDNNKIYLEVHPRGEEDGYYTGFTTLDLDDAEVLYNELGKMIAELKKQTPANNRG